MKPDIFLFGRFSERGQAQRGAVYRRRMEASAIANLSTHWSSARPLTGIA